ncbi:kynureninase [Sandarakinorhabdus cyanobacteriorum]|uniref:Kynureninase n=1 Tax=Sandarakinorhabdus cyanobacteriorum TaxID=1981098 RepID=A0A255YC39_9SPHN|nr:aminotransferase class V-fold PLP-dependent enzyme [Sandarakinorhabdus cyanobacteriorum]OYQ26771.1 kynureninase [Sandarakinorhabdus cyanobacteriorum]
MQPTPAQLAALDAADPLAHARGRFRLPEGLVYLDGNSLGPLPAALPDALAATVAGEWGDGLIRSWNDAGWIDLPVQLGAAIAPIVGAEPDSVVACDSVSLNLFKLASAALGLRPGRRTILMEADDFPTDAYVMQGLARLAGVTLKRVPRADLLAALNDDVALLLLTHAHYVTGHVHDMAAMNAAAHAVGALTLWDLSHSAGALVVRLDADGADFAVGCGYKYLNGGPGAPAFAYLARRHWDAALPALTGWMGHAAPFDFAGDYAPAAGARRLLTGTPPILAMRALEAGVATFAGIDLAQAEAKSRALVHLFADGAAGLPGVTVDAPPAGRHAAHVIIRHPQARRVMAALIARGVVGDMRPPDAMRFGFPALTTRYADVGLALAALQAVLASGEWQDERFAPRGMVS